MNIEERFHINQSGRGTDAMLFAHGFGCDQSMWRWVAPEFERNHRVVLFDLAGSGRADPTAYDRSRHGSLDGYARDVLDIVDALDLRNVTFVGHSVSSIIGLLAAIEEPERFERLILVSPSPCYINDGTYSGGFSRGDIEGLIDALDSNYLGWASSMAPLIMGRPDRLDLVQELENSFCRTHPDVARAFARVTFLSDNREDLCLVRTPSLILQVTDDVIAPVAVGRFMHDRLPNSELCLVETRGHCPHMSAPRQTVDAMKKYLARHSDHV